MTPFEIDQLNQERCDRQFIADLNDWLDSQPEIPPKPCCGQCLHFEALDLDGIRGQCKATTYQEWSNNACLTLHPAREATDEICNLYDEACPF